MSGEVQSRIRDVLVGEVGVPDVTPLGRHALSFRWLGFEYVSNCQSSKWLHLGIVLRVSEDMDGNPANVLDLSHVPPGEMTPRLAYLNGSVLYVRFAHGGDGTFRIEWTGFAFGDLAGPGIPDPDPLPPGFEAPSLGDREIAEVFESAMDYLRFSITLAFKVFERVPKRRPRGFPAVQDRQYPDSFALFRRAVAESGVPWSEAMEPDPTLRFVDGGGAAFTLVTYQPTRGDYALLMECRELRALDPEGAPTNVIGGEVDQDLLDHLAASATRMLGMKTYGSVEHGTVTLMTSGILSALDQRAVTDLLPFLTGTLAGFAEMAFREAGIALLTSARERARRSG